MGIVGVNESWLLCGLWPTRILLVFLILVIWQIAQAYYGRLAQFNVLSSTYKIQ